MRRLRSCIYVLAFLFTTGLMTVPSVVSAEERTLTVYTYESFIADWGPGPVVGEAFEKQCDCTLDWVGVADGVALLNRLKLEGDSTKADIVLGLDTNLISEARATGLFEPSGIDLSKIDVPGGWTDDTFVPFDYGYFAVVYDTEAIGESTRKPEGSRRRRSQGTEDRHPGSANLNARPRAGALDEGRLWRRRRQWPGRNSRTASLL